MGIFQRSRFASIVTATLLALPIATAIGVAPAQAEIVIRSRDFGIRIGGRRRYDRYPKRYHRRRRYRGIYSHPTSPYYRRQKRYRHLGKINRHPDIIYRRTEILGPGYERQIVTESPEYIIPSRRILGPRQPYRRPRYRRFRRRYHQRHQLRRHPRYAPGNYLIPRRSRK